jgi:hypothetical protein
LKSASIGHIPSDVQPILEKPNTCAGNAEGLALAPKAHCERTGEHKLSNRAAIWFQPRTEKPDNRMAGFMKEKIRVIEQENEARLRPADQQKKDAKAGPETKEPASRNRLPFVLFHDVE